MAGVAEEQGVVVDLDGVVSSLEERLALAGGPQEDVPFTIFRVPVPIREANRNQFVPRVVSIGPYYWGHDDLQTMEQLKCQYLNASLARNPGVTLRDCLERMEAMEARARRCYAGSIGLDRRAFVETLLLDGCFILETVHRCNAGKLDATLRLGCLSDFIITDFLLLENQIPFFVLQTLFDLLMAPHTEPNVSLPEFLVQPFSNLPHNGTQAASTREVHHLLHLFHLCYTHDPSRNQSGISRCNPLLSYVSAKAKALVCWSRPTLGRRTQGSSRPGFSAATIPCATELDEAGIKFKKKETAKNILDITFGDGTLEIPKLLIYSVTITVFMNLAVFEQCLAPSYRYFAAFSTFIQCIINTGNDVAILHQCGIIENYTGSDEEAARFFNQLSHVTTYMGTNDEKHYLAGMFRNVNHYRESDLHKWRAGLMHSYFSWRAGLKHNYFRNPWAILSMLAAIILLILTFLQTFFAIYAYFRPPS